MTAANSFDEHIRERYRLFPSFVHTGFKSPITEVAVILLSEKNGISHALGTAVIIGGNIALTARHVLDEYFFQHEGIRLDDAHDATTFHLKALQFIENGARAWSWHVTQIWHDNTDIAFLKLTPTAQEQVTYKMRRAKLQLFPPPVGERIAAFGYHSSETTVDGNKTTVTTNPYTSSGFVKQLHQPMRDSAVLPFPCFETNARFDGGMSGGPVFNSDGHLCGIVCSGLAANPTVQNDENTSYVSSLWPAMGMRVSFNRNGDYPQDVFYPAIELAKGGFIDVVDLERVIVVQNPEGGTTTLLKT